jgi:hypothetical protein
MDQSNSSSLPISKVDVFSFCDLITTCNEVCIEKVLVETCDDFIAEENDKLMQAV